MQSDLYPYKKRRFGQRHRQKKDNVKTQRKEDHLQARERSLVQILLTAVGRKQPCHEHLDLGLPAP